MKSTFQIVLVVLFLTSCLTMEQSTNNLSSDRINDDLVNIVDRKLTLDNVMGWYRDTNGQWSSKKNTLSYIDSFKSFKIYTVECNNIEYIIFMKIYTTGYYKYPNIKVDWVSYDAANCFLIKKDDFKILLKDDEIEINTIPIVDRKMITATNDIKKLRTELNNFIKKSSEKENYSNWKFEIPTYYKKQDNVVRFIFNDGTSHLKEHIGTLPERFYYECDIKKFVSFFQYYMK